MRACCPEGGGSESGAPPSPQNILSARAKMTHQSSALVKPVSSPRPGRQIVVCVCVRERERERKTERESERAGSRTQEHTLSLLSSPPHTYSHTHTLAHLHMGLGPTPQLAVLSFVQLGRLSRGGQAPHGPCHKARVTSDTIRVALTLIQSD